MLVLKSDRLNSLITQVVSSEQPAILKFEVKDGGDVYQAIFEDAASNSVSGYFLVIKEESSLDAALASVDPSLPITIIAQPISPGEQSFPIAKTTLVNNKTYHIVGYRKHSPNTAPVKDEIMLAPIREQLFSRLGGLFETDVLAKKRVAIVGLGSGGSPIVLELVKSGVQNFILIDDDRLEVGNIARHVCGLSDLGRYKTKAVKDLLLDKNPYVQVETLEIQLGWEYKNKFEQLVQGVDLVICATDNRESRMLVNRVCVDNNKVCLYGGAFRRAYGGQVLRVFPHASMCYQCFLDNLPDVALDEEISNPDQVLRVQYSPNDPTVPIEPGLSTDIAPISLFISKLAILELLKDGQTTFESLYEDMVSSWYLWLNRREKGTAYEKLKPLAYEVDNMHVMRWYGVEVERNPNCPVCGEFLANTDVKPTQEDLKFFDKT